MLIHGPTLTTGYYALDFCLFALLEWEHKSKECVTGCTADFDGWLNAGMV
jgi:hypothetical protein